MRIRILQSKSPLLIVILFMLQIGLANADEKNNVSKKAVVGYKVGQIAPEFTLKSLSGKAHSLSSLTKNGYAMLVFWAVECVYCYAHVKDFNELHAKYFKKGLTIAAINIGAEYNDDVAEYVKDNNIKYLVLANRLDNLDVSEAYHSIVTPTIVLVSSKGRVVYYGNSLPKITKFIK